MTSRLKALAEVSIMATVSNNYKEKLKFHAMINDTLFLKCIYSLHRSVLGKLYWKHLTKSIAAMQFINSNVLS